MARSHAHDHDGVTDDTDDDEDPVPADGQEHTHDANGTVSDVSDSHTHAETDKTLADHEHGNTTEVGSQDGEGEEGRIASVDAHAHARDGSAVEDTTADDSDVTARHTTPAGL